MWDSFTADVGFYWTLGEQRLCPVQWEERSSAGPIKPPQKAFAAFPTADLHKALGPPNRDTYLFYLVWESISEY